MAKPTGTLKHRPHSRFKKKKRATERLIEDHKKLKVLFAEFRKSQDEQRKRQIFETTEEEIKVDSTPEKEFLSPKPRAGSIEAELQGERMPFVDEIRGERL